MSEAIACAVLAAGGSSRLGRPKQLVPMGGETLVARAVRAVTSGLFGEVAVVVGAQAEAVAREVAGRVAVVENAGWSEGMGSSVRAAAGWASSRGHGALVLVPCDQPLLTVGHLEALAACHRAGSDLVASAYGGVLGIPALFAAAWFGRLRALRGPRGAAALLRSLPEVCVVAWPDGEVDVDTEADVERATLRLEQARRRLAR